MLRRWERGNNTGFGLDCFNKCSCGNPSVSPNPSVSVSVQCEGRNGVPCFKFTRPTAHEAHEQILMIVHVTLAGERTRS